MVTPPMRDAAGVGDFQLVQAAQKRALAATARPDEHDGFAALLRVVNAVQHAVSRCRI